MSNQTTVDGVAPLSTNTTDSAVMSSGDVLLQTCAAFAFGVIVLLVLGFAPMSAVHNAAHDTRHSVTFPCH